MLRTRRIPCFAMLLIAALLSAAAAYTANAGTICGTVTDAQSSAPVAQAAVFLYDSLDVYTGIHDDTNINGQYCLDNVPAGTYTVQVQRDDYVIATVSGVVVADSPTSVNIVAHPGLRLRAWPNPANERVQFEFGAPFGEAVTLEVYDVKGRLVRGWRGTGNGAQTIGWDLRDTRGRRISSGIYMVRLQAGDTRVTSRFVHLR